MDLFEQHVFLSRNPNSPPPQRESWISELENGVLEAKNAQRKAHHFGKHTMLNSTPFPKAAAEPYLTWPSPAQANPARLQEKKQDSRTGIASQHIYSCSPLLSHFKKDTQIVIRCSCTSRHTAQQTVQRLLHGILHSRLYKGYCTAYCTVDCTKARQ